MSAPNTLSQERSSLARKAANTQHPPPTMGRQAVWPTSAKCSMTYKCQVKCDLQVPQLKCFAACVVFLFFSCALEYSCTEGPWDDKQYDLRSPQLEAMVLHWWIMFHRWDQKLYRRKGILPSNQSYVNSGGMGTTHNINRTELTGIKALTNMYTKIATDSACFEARLENEYSSLKCNEPMSTQIYLNKLNT